MRYWPSVSSTELDIGQVLFFAFVCSNTKFRLKQNKKKEETKARNLVRARWAFFPVRVANQKTWFSSSCPHTDLALYKISVTSFFTYTFVLCINPLCYNAYFSNGVRQSKMEHMYILYRIDYLVPVIQTLDSTINPINHYPATNYYGKQLRYPLGRNLSGG